VFDYLLLAKTEKSRKKSEKDLEQDGFGKKNKWEECLSYLSC